MGYGIPDIGYCVISYIRYPISYILYPLLSSKSMASSTIDGVVVHNTAGTRKHSILGCVHRQNIDNIPNRAGSNNAATGRPSLSLFQGLRPPPTALDS